MNTPNKQFDRRSFLKNTATAIGGLYVAFQMPAPMQRAFASDAATGAQSGYANAFVHIAPDNSITMIINRIEMGQGVHTSMAQLIAEELDVDWTKIQSRSSNSDKIYNDPNFQMIMTGGSTSLAHSWQQYRTIGAGMREMLLSAAAKHWKVPVSELSTKDGFVVHAKKGKISYGELATAANKLPFPTKPKLKDKKDFKFIGKSQKRVDAAAKSNGSAIFGMDVRLPNMLYAAITRPAIHSAKLVSFNEKAARAIPGVINVFKVGANKVAVIAKNSYSANSAKDALEAKWDYGTDKKTTSESMMKNFKQLSNRDAPIAKNTGNADKEMANSATKIEAEFEFPHLAHAAMEPLNCTIDFDGKNAKLYGAFQMPTGDHAAVAKVLGIAHEKIEMNVTYAGGSFGRRATPHSDWVVDACEVAKVLKKPVKVVWSREDDMSAGYYRPMVYHKATIGFDAKNKLHAWQHHIVGQSIMKGTFFEGFMIKDGVEATLVEGVNDTHYKIPHFKVKQTLGETPLTALWWRSVGHTHTSYVMETLIDEVATKQKTDALELRLEMLKSSPRHIAVLELLKKKTNWGKAKIPNGRAWGLAVHESFGSVVGHIVEVSMVDNMPKVHKVWSAAHCGQVVNPIGAATQVEGGIVLGLSAAFYQQIELKDGMIQQNNFDSYEVLRMSEMPVVDVSFVDSDEPPTGLGEPGVPPIAPAVANAVFQLTGKRLRKLPFTRELRS